MIETSVKIIVDTSEIDEAIVKVKILNEELEKSWTQVVMLSSLKERDSTAILNNLKEDLEKDFRTIDQTEFMDELVKKAKDRLLVILSAEKDLREKLWFDDLEELPKEYLELKKAFNNVIAAEQQRINPVK